MVECTCNFDVEVVMTDDPHDAALLPRDALNLVPHRPPMLLVGSLIAREDDFAIATARLPEDGPWVSGGQVAPEYLIELVAQTVAMANGYDCLREDRKPHDGMLVGVDRFCFSGTAGAGEDVRIETRLVLEFGGVTVLHGEVWSMKELLAEGDLKVWEDLAGDKSVKK